VVFLWLVRRHLAWPAGWPGREERREVASFAGSVAFSSLLLNLFGSLVPYLMGVLGAGIVAIGHVGLALRLSQLVQGVLQQLSGAVFPATRVALEKFGFGKVRAWRSFACRLGAVAVLAVSGVFALAGRFIVARVWGADFAGSAGVIALAFAGLLPRWIGDQYSAMFMVDEKPGLTARSVTAMLGAFVPLAVLWMPRGGGVGAMGAMAAGAGAFMAAAWSHMRRLAPEGLGLKALAGPAAWTAAAHLAFVRFPFGPWAAAALTAAWAAGFAALVLGTGSLALFELRQLAGHMRAVAPGAGEEGAA